MYPQLDFGFVEISSYSFFTFLALVAVVSGSYWFGRRRGFEKVELVVMLVGMSLAAFVGARMFNVIVNYEWYQSDPRRIFELSASGFSLYGGIILAVVVGLMISYWRKIGLLKFADTITPFVGIGIVLQRVGCFLNGCCFGKVTDLPWGVTFPIWSHTHLHQMSGDILGSSSVHAVHPTQLYELIAALIGTVIAFVLMRRGKVDGTVFLVCGIYFSAFRWVNMQFRVLPYSEDVAYIWYPLFYGLTISMCGFLLIGIHRKSSF